MRQTGFVIGPTLICLGVRMSLKFVSLCSSLFRTVFPVEFELPGRMVCVLYLVALWAEIYHCYWRLISLGVKCRIVGS